MAYKKIIKQVLVWILISIFILWVIFPIFWMVSLSFKTGADVYEYPPQIFKFTTIQNYISLLSDINFLKSLLNSVIIAISTAIISLVIGLPASYISVRFKFKGKTNLNNMVIMTRMVPPVVVLLPYFIIFKYFNLYDTHIAVIIMHVIINLSLVIWVSKGFFKDIPESIEESALLEGASYWGVFLKIIIPISKPIMVTLGIICFLFSWNEYIYSTILTSKNAITASIFITKFMSYETARWGMLMASSVLIILPPIIFISIIQKGLIRGLTYGAVKE